MGDPRGFLKIKREAMTYRPVCERVKDYRDVALLKSVEKTREQAARCMDCGTPFCNWGCPIGNYIPEWNDAAYSSKWEKAFMLLNATNILPEVTGRVCPALCETACVLGINDDPVTIRDNELFIIEKAFKQGMVKARPPEKRTGKKVAIIGSGPAGISAAAAINRQGHSVKVIESDDETGGFMRYGIPDFKLEKHIIDRRIDILKQEGVVFLTGVKAGDDISGKEILGNYDAVCIASGCRIPRDLNVPGRNFKGIHQAVDYLKQSNIRVANKKINNKELIDAKGKNVVVIGGGDTGADCVGTANRQGAKCIVQIEIMPEPPKQRPLEQPWPRYPFVFKKTTSHEEGAMRKWSVMTKEFTGTNNKVEKIKAVRVEFVEKEGKNRPDLSEIPGSEFEIRADLVILAMGFTNPEKKGLLEQLDIKLNEQGSIIRDPETGKTSAEKVFAAGDVARGPSLIVWAIADGLAAARGINDYLRDEK